MRLGITKEPDWEYAASLLANADDTAQATFLKAFVKECKSWGTAWQVQQQLSHVNNRLTHEERETLSMLTYEE